jgi:hypothetical protein
VSSPRLFTKKNLNAPFLGVCILVASSSGVALKNAMCSDERLERERVGRAAQ